MVFFKYINYLLVVIGCCIAVYAQAGETQDVVVLIFGIVILMFGLFRISSTIPSKNDTAEENKKNE